MTDQEKTDWAAALRSGEYGQVRTHLKRGDNYCCLGVKMMAEGRVPLDEEVENLLSTIEPQYDVLLSQFVTGRSGMVFFTRLNDRGQLTFEEIALVIENVPEEEWK